MNYRIATVADGPLLAEMNQSLIRDEGHRNPMSLVELEVRMAGWITGEYTAVLVEDDGTAIGYALFHDGPEFSYLRQFYVRPEQRRQGIGRAAIDWLRENAWPSSKPVRLDVLIGNRPAIAFWRAVGFQDYCQTMEFK
ncbi:MAG: N-acetyltransferase family protein [Planctomycetaceae bacterium]